MTGHVTVPRKPVKIPVSKKNMNRLARPKLLSRCVRALSKLPTSRPFHSSNRQLPKTPDLIYVPHVVRWIKTKLRFKYLKKIWDPEFSEGAFIYGTTRAVCRITEIIHSGETEQLDELMTDSARIRLRDDIRHRLTANQRRLIVLKPDDIKILVPTAVTFSREGPARVCRVGLRLLALKWHEVGNENYRLVLVALQTEFSRDYGERAPPDWTISGFSVLDCAMLTEAPVAR